MSGLFGDKEGDQGLPGRQRRLAMSAILLCTIIGVLDHSVVVVALPTIARDLNADLASSIGIVTAYQLAGAMSILTFSALGAIIGFGRIFIGGLTLFTVSSLGCTLTESLPLLIALRFVQGLGAAAAMCMCPALFRTIFPLRLLGAVLGINALVVATTTALSPTIGGLVVQAVQWQWLFALNVPVGALAIWLGLKTLPKETIRKGHFDLPGALLSALAMGSFILSMDWIFDPSARHLGTIVLVIAVVSALLFIRRQRHAPTPLLPLEMFRSRHFSMASATSIHCFIGQSIAFIALPFLFQSVYGFTPLVSALLFTPWPIAIVIAAPLAGRLADRYSAPLLCTGGLLVFTLGLALLAMIGTTASTPDILWRVFICGLGFGFFQTPNNRELLSKTPERLIGNAAGVLAMSRTFGQTLGATVMAIVITLSPIGATSGIDARGSAIAMWIAAFCTLSASIMSMLRIRR